jgi:hypothetical protein
MNIPTFTAEVSLCKTSGHYQTGRRILNSRKQTNNAIYPAMMKEVIEVHGCAPGSILWENGGDWGCNPIDFGGFDGGGGGGPIVVPDDGPRGPRSGPGPGDPDPTGRFRYPAGLRQCSEVDKKNATENYGKAIKECMYGRPEGENFVVKCGSNSGNPFCCWSDTPKRKWNCKTMPKDSDPSDNAH